MTWKQISAILRRTWGAADLACNLQVSSVELERACTSAVPGILEAAAVAVPMSGGGPDQLVMFIVPSTTASLDLDSVRHKCQQAIRSGINPLFKLEKVAIAAIKLPPPPPPPRGDFAMAYLSCLDIFL